LKLLTRARVCVCVCIYIDGTYGSLTLEIISIHKKTRYDRINRYDIIYHNFNSTLTYGAAKCKLWNLC